MIFQGKYDRARRLQQERMGDAPRALEQEDLAEKLEKGDTLALILSALITIVPVVLIFLLIAAAAGYFFIVR